MGGLGLELGDFLNGSGLCVDPVDNWDERVTLGKLVSVESCEWFKGESILVQYAVPNAWGVNAGWIIMLVW